MATEVLVQRQFQQANVCVTPAQVDVTAEVLAQRELQKAHKALEADRRRLDLLLERQYELIECVSRVDDISNNPANSQAAHELVQGVMRQLARTPSGNCAQESDGIKILHLLGEGSVSEGSVSTCWAKAV